MRSVRSAQRQVELGRLGNQLPVLTKLIRSAKSATYRTIRDNSSSSSSSSSFDSAGQRLTPHSRTLEVRPGRINTKLELHYDYDVKGVILNYYSVSQAAVSVRCPLRPG